MTDAQWQVIEKLIPNQGKRKVCLRMVINGIRWLKHTGRQWREMRSDFPCWQTVSYYFNRWGKNGTLTLIMNQLVKAGRIQKNRNELASRDSQSVRKGMFCSLDRDYEKLARSAEAFIQMAFCDLILAKI